MIRQAVLLVGGRGTRVWPLTETIPKGLLPVHGTPFIELQLELLAQAGVEHVILATGATHAGAWREYAAARSHAPFMDVVVEDVPLDTAGPVIGARDMLDERFLVLNGDVVLETAVTDFIAGSPPLAAVLALVAVPDTSAYGVVVTDSEGRVERFIEKPPAGTAPVDTVNAGMYLMTREVAFRYEPGPLSFERRVFPDLAELGELGGHVVEGEWLDIGTGELYLAAHDTVAAGNSRLLTVAEPHRANGADVAGRREGTWSWIGPDAVVEEGAVVKESVILDGARVRSGAHVLRSVVGWQAEVGRHATVRQASLIGRGAAIGERCEIAAGARVAPEASLPPGSIRFSPPEATPVGDGA